MSMNPEIVKGLEDKALATFERTDGAAADTAELVEFEDYRWGGKYVIVRTAGEVVAVYKMVVRFGPAKPVRDEYGGLAFQVDSMSTGLKRMKRIPKGLIPEKEV